MIKIDFAGGVLKNRQELDQKINGILLKTAQSLGVDYELKDIQGRFGEIIAGAYQRFGERTVVRTICFLEFLKCTHHPRRYHQLWSSGHNCHFG